MSSDTSTVPPSWASTPASDRFLQTSFGSKSKQELLNQAHDNIKLLEVSFDHAERCAAMMDHIQSRFGLDPGVQNALILVQHMTSILKLDRSVDECLFGDRALDMAFAESLDKGVVEECRGLAEYLGTLTSFVSRVRGNLPRELQDELSIIKSRRSTHAEDPRHGEVPSLMASYDTSTDDEIKDKARGAIQVLEDLLCRAKALALSSLPRLGSHIGFENPANAICDMLDIGGDLALLRRYVEKLVHTKTDTALDERVVTSFIAGKFDRATSRLANRSKAQISTLEKFAAPRDTPPSNVGERQSRDLAEAIKQILADNETIGSLIWRRVAMLQDLTKQGNPETEEDLEDMNPKDLLGQVATLTVLTCKIQEDIENNHGALVDSLGRDFVGKVLEAAHDLSKAHVSTLRQLISDVEGMLGLSPAEAAARFPTVNGTTGLLNFLMRQ